LNKCVDKAKTETVNRFILKALRTRLNKSKGLWKEELYNTLGLPLYTLDNHQRNSYRLQYGTDAMIPVEVGEPSTRRLLFQQQQNEENMRVELETTEEVLEMAKIREEVVKLQVARRYNTKVQP